jgi:hypothetical protein
MTWKEYKDAHFTPEEQREIHEGALKIIRRQERRQKCINFLKRIFFIRSSEKTHAEVQ